MMTEVKELRDLVKMRGDDYCLKPKEPQLDPEINPIYQGLNRTNKDVKKSLFANYREELTLNRVLKIYNNQCKGKVVGIRYGQRHLWRNYQKLQNRKEMIVRARSAPEQLEEDQDESEELEPERPLTTTVHFFGTDIKTRPLSGNVRDIETIARENKPVYSGNTFSADDRDRTHEVTSPSSKSSIVYHEAKRPKSTKRVKVNSRPQSAAIATSRPQSGVFITQRLSTPERFNSAISRPRSHQYRTEPSAYDVIAQQKDIDPHVLPGDIDRNRFINSSYYRKSKSPRLRDHLSNEVAVLFRQMKIKV
ncbi:uncharacterized protein LOC135502715 isoform X2 [Lineus longissimus]|uniref:uncharacterized protein LOC135502715 isoform X2 n=1 Tax=Lineus longissimus TaxID=88925 RepID=UPI002B4C9118